MRLTLRVALSSTLCTLAGCGAGWMAAGPLSPAPVAAAGLLLFSVAASTALAWYAARPWQSLAEAAGGLLAAPRAAVHARVVELEGLRQHYADWRAAAEALQREFAPLPTGLRALELQAKQAAAAARAGRAAAPARARLEQAMSGAVPLAAALRQEGGTLNTGLAELESMAGQLTLEAVNTAIEAAREAGPSLALGRRAAALHAQAEAARQRTGHLRALCGQMEARAMRLQAALAPPMDAGAAADAGQLPAESAPSALAERMEALERSVSAHCRLAEALQQRIQAPGAAAAPAGSLPCADAAPADCADSQGRAGVNALSQPG